MKFPTFVHWKHFFKILSKKEKISFFGFLVLAAASLAALAVSVWQNRTQAVPADGGIYAEGVAGQPRFLNPVYSDSSAVDRDIVQLLFAGLLEYDKDGRVVGGLADYKISEDGKTYDFTLKDGLKWSDGQALTGDDVIYTVKTIQDPTYKSPLRPQWLGVETEKISETAFRFKLAAPYSAFLETCVLKIIPRHVWEKTGAEGFSLAEANLSPVGSGPYRLKKNNPGQNNRIASVDLEPNPYFYGKKPRLAQISFVFFDNYEGLAAAFKRGQIQGFVPETNAAPANPPAGTSVREYAIPRYFAVFFNAEKNQNLADGRVRTALAKATDKEEILKNVLDGHGSIVDSPMPGDIYGLSAPQNLAGYNPEEANKILDDAGYKSENGQVRQKTLQRQAAFQFTKTLTKGSNQTAEIKELQKCLAREVMPDLEPNGNFGDKTLEAVNLFQEKYRADILDPQNIKEPTGDVKLATREKLNQVCFPSGNETDRLEIELTVADQEPFVSIAGLIKKQWEAAGAAVNINAVNINDIERDIVKPRNYQAVLFGQAMGMVADPYLFWHSSQIRDPGLNFSLYQNKDADKILEDIRNALNENQRLEKMNELQNLIAKDQPAIFLYNPKFAYVVSKNVKGMTAGVIADPGRRFADIADWYINEKRVWKK